jgi:PPOX class probable F420-dependent enzyme
MSAGGELARERSVSLATFRRNGADVKTPVWFPVIDGKLYVVTAGDAGKVKRLRHSSRVLVAPSDARGGVRGTWRDATARIVTDPASIDRAHKALLGKYGGQAPLLDLFSRLAGPIRAARGWRSSSARPCRSQLRGAGASAGSGPGAANQEAKRCPVSRPTTV